LDYLELARATAPEIGMTVLAIAILLLDVTLMRPWPAARRARWLGALAALGLAGVLALVCSHGVAMGASQWADPARTIVIDQLGLGLKALVLVLSIGTVLLSVHYEFTPHVGEYFAITVLAAIGMSFLVVTENLLMVLVAIELLSVCLYILTAFHKGLLRSAEAAAKYFMFGATSSAFLLFGLSYVVGITGAVTVSDLATAIAAHGGHPPLLLIAGLAS
jgi:NADH-quinone oxidoreductase subunit N